MNKWFPGQNRSVGTLRFAEVWASYFYTICYDDNNVVTCRVRFNALCVGSYGPGWIVGSLIINFWYIKKNLEHNYEMLFSDFKSGTATIQGRIHGPRLLFIQLVLIFRLDWSYKFGVSIIAVIHLLAMVRFRSAPFLYLKTKILDLFFETRGVKMYYPT